MRRLRMTSTPSSRTRPSPTGPSWTRTRTCHHDYAHEEDAPQPHQVVDAEPAEHEHLYEHETAEAATPEQAAEAPATAPETPPANLAVIGRYDSEGTSYVMYSDGSIEAQSEAGIYRFNSMAELKAFIEG